MMPQSFVAPSSVPDPYEVLLGASGAVSLFVLADVSLTWQDGTTGLIPASTLATSAYGGTSVNNAADNYLLLIVKGQAVPVLLKEQDRATADSVLGGTPTWGLIRRIENGEDYPVSQI